MKNPKKGFLATKIANVFKIVGKKIQNFLILVKKVLEVLLKIIWKLVKVAGYILLALSVLIPMSIIFNSGFQFFSEISPFEDFLDVLIFAREVIYVVIILVYFLLVGGIILLIINEIEKKRYSILIFFSILSGLLIVYELISRYVIFGTCFL